MEHIESQPNPLDEIANIKRRIAEIAFAPLDEHGEKFAGVNNELSSALSSVEGLSN